MKYHIFIVICHVAVILASTGLGQGRRVGHRCDPHTFESSVHGFCLPNFNQTMKASGYQDTCPWPHMRAAYIRLKLCLEEVVTPSRCRDPPLVDEIFLEVHKTYFSQCTRIQDPPLSTLIMLIVPETIAALFLPLLCIPLTTWKTEWS